MLVAGGTDLIDVLDSADLFDPSAGAFSQVRPMTDSREMITATLLPSGEVLLAGGVDDAGLVLASAEIYKP